MRTGSHPRIKSEGMLRSKTLWQRVSSDPRSRRGAPCGAPAHLDHGKSEETKQRQQAEKQEARAEAAGHSLGDAERLGKEEATDAAGATDHTGHQADFLPEAERDELEYGAIAHAECEDADREQE